MAGYDAIVLGGHVEALVAAGMLGKAGRRVVVLATAEHLGGPMITTDPVSGFRFDGAADAGGYLSPEVMRELALVHHGLTPIATTGSTVAPTPTGPPLRLTGDPEGTARRLATISAADGARWETFSSTMVRFSGLLEHLYRAPTPRPGITEARNLAAMAELGIRARGLGKADLLEFLRVAPMPVADLLDDWFEHDGLKAVLGVPAVRHLCQGPRSAGTAFTMLHQLVGARAVPRGRPRFVGGPGALPWALEVAGRERGVEFRTDCRVREVVVRGGRVAGVVLETGEELVAATVVSGHDSRRTLLELLDPGHLDPDFVHDVRHRRYRGVAAKVNLALSGLPSFQGGIEPDDLAGTVVLCDDMVQLEQAYDAAKYGRVSDRLVAELTVPTVLDPSRAPEGAHVVSMWLQYAPYHRREGAWDAAAREELGDRAVALLAQVAPDVPSLVVGREIFTPVDLEARFGLTEGHLYQGELGLDQVLFMRPLPGWSHYRTPIDGLYLCGPATHPGGGIIGQSGLLAARKVVEDTR